MRAVVPAMLAALALLASLPSGAVTGVITDSKLEVFKEATTGIGTALGDDARIYDLAQLSPEEIAQRLSSDRPQAVIAMGLAAVRLVAGSSTRTPVVFLLVPEPSVATAALAGRQVQGIALQVPPKEVLTLLRRIAPKAHTLWTIYSDRTSGWVVENLQGAASAAGYLLDKTEVPDAAAAARALGVPPSRVDAFILLGDPVVRNAAFDAALLRLAFSRGFPVVGASRKDVQAGALFALQLDAQALGRQAAELARSSGKGPKPLIVPPLGARLVLNLASARELGLTVPDDVRRSAAEELGK